MQPGSLLALATLLLSLVWALPAQARALFSQDAELTRQYHEDISGRNGCRRRR